MKQTLIAILVMMNALFNGASVFADGDSIGIIPGKLAWSVDSIVEQWTLTKDVDGETIEQTLYDFSTRKSDDDHNSTPVDQRYNRRLVITIGFINLGSEVIALTIRRVWKRLSSPIPKQFAQTPSR